MSKVCKTIGIISKGKLIAHGTLEELKKELGRVRAENLRIIVEAVEPVSEIAHEDIISAEYSETKRKVIIEAKSGNLLFVFQRMSWQMTMLGGILAIAMGFDLISREKESRSLKSLLAHPIFRDEIINGKALGGILALVFAVGIAQSNRYRTSKRGRRGMGAI